MSRVSIVGSGNVGANAAFFIAEKGVTDVLLIDIKQGLSRGKTLDIMEAAPIRRYRNSLTGSDSLADIAGSQMVVVAVGAIRSPGMRREDLYAANAPLIRTLAPEVARLAPESVVVIATEPVDSLTALFTLRSGHAAHPRPRAGRHPGFHAPARPDCPGAGRIHGDRLRHGHRQAFRRHDLPAPLLQRLRGAAPPASPGGAHCRPSWPRRGAPGTSWWSWQRGPAPTMPPRRPSRSWQTRST